MRVLHVHTRYRQPGGEDSVVEAERDLLRSAGHHVVPLDFENPSDAGPAAAALVRSPWNSSAAHRVVERAKEAGVDIVHVHNTWFSLSPAVFAALSTAAIPSVATFHNYRLVCVNALLFREGKPCELCVGRSPWPGVRYGCYRDSRVASAAVAATLGVHRRRGTWQRDVGVAIALTEFARSKLLEGGLPEQRTVVVPNFVSDPGPRRRNASGSDELVFVGRLAPEKGLAVLVEAWSRIAPQDLRLVVIGDGPEAARLRDTAPRSIEFAGRLPADQVAERMLGARALLFPSVWFEGQPMVILEALAAGLPIAVSDLGALPETAGRGGLSVAAGDPDAWARVLGTLEDDAALDRLSVAARREYEERYTPAVALDRRLDVYQQAMDWAVRPT